MACTSGSANDGNSDVPPGKKAKAESKGGGRKRGNQDVTGSQSSQAGRGSEVMDVEKQQAGEQKTKLHKEKTARLLKLMVKALLRNM